MTTVSGRSDATVAIRAATAADLLSVFRIEQASFAQPWPFAAFEEYLDAPAFLVAHDGEAVVGYLVADVSRGYTGSSGHVKDIAVAPAYRGDGIGRALLERGLQVLESHDVGHVKLEVRPSNGPARALYQDVGFEPRRVLPGYYEDGENALVMVRHAGSRRG